MVIFMNCDICNCEMKKLNLIGDMHGMPIYLSSKKKGLLETEKRSSVYAFVCPKCGQIKLIAQDPSI